MGVRRRDPCRRAGRVVASARYVLAWAVLAILPTVAEAAGESPASASRSGRQPNIIVILADDLGIGNVSCYGADHFKTPHIDALAASGIRFGQCYSAPNCGPSRALMMTGRYGFRTGMTGNDKPSVAMLEAASQTEVMIPRLLSARGYATASAGKWSQVPLQPSAWGFDEYIRTKGSGAYWPTAERATYTINGTEQPWREGEYMPDITQRFVIDFINRHKDGPFYVHYPLAHVHTDMLPTPDSAADSQDLFSDNVAYMDKLVGDLMAELDRLGLRENTLVMFAGDNGVHQGEAARSTIRGRPLSGSKGTLLEGGSRVPLVVSWPSGIPAGAVCDDLVGLVDVLPTLADVAGADLPVGVEIDGVSFAPQLHGDRGSPREWIFVMLGRHWYAREAGWKLTDAGDLFDMRDAPFAEHPVAPNASDPAAAAGRQRLEAVLATLDPASGKLGDESGKHAKKAKE
ncbi:MAG: sulfatase-like hydrolase/transferase [Pirellulales bacterium]